MEQRVTTYQALFFRSLQLEGVIPDSKTVTKPALINWAANQERALVMEAAANLHEDLPLGAPRMSRLAYLATLQTRLGKEKAHQRELAKAAEIGSQAHGYSEWTLRRERGEVVGPEPRMIYPEALLQVSAYTAALREMEHAPPFVWGAVVRLPKTESDPEPEIRLIAPAEQEHLFATFLHVQALWNWQQALRAAAGRAA
jgi:hypothetical protein